jgi:hypothetical protein
LVGIATFSAGAGILAGLLTAGAWFSGLAPLRPVWATLTLAVAIALVFDSLVALIGPKRIFYVSALLSALLAGSEWLGSGSDATAANPLVIAIAGVTLVLSIVAARYEPEISEQSHPLNLPIFG